MSRIWRHVLWLSLALTACEGHTTPFARTVSLDSPVAKRDKAPENVWLVWPPGVDGDTAPVQHPLKDIVAFRNAADGSLQLWNMRDNTAAGTLPAVRGNLVELRWSDDGRDLAALASSTTDEARPLLSLFDTETLTLRITIEAPEDTLGLLAWRRPFLVIKRGNSVDVFGETGQLIRRAVAEGVGDGACDAKAGLLACFIFQPFGIVVSDIATGREVSRIAGFQQPERVELSPDGTRLLVSSGELIDLKSGERMHVDATSQRHAWTDSELQFLAPESVTEECPVDARSWWSGKTPTGSYPDRVVRRVAFDAISPGGSAVSTLPHFWLVNRGYVERQTGRIGCVPPRLNEPVRRWRWSDPYWLEISLTEDGLLDRRVHRVWDARTATVLVSGRNVAFVGPELALASEPGGGDQLVRLGTGQSVARFAGSWVSHDLRVLVGRSFGSPVDLEVWDLTKPGKRATLHSDGAPQAILGVQIAADGAVIAAVVEERGGHLHVRVWDGVSGRMLMSTPEEVAGGLAYVLADDGARLIAIPNAVKGTSGVWETATGKVRLTLPPADAPGLTPDVLWWRSGARLALASAGATPLTPCPGRLEAIDETRRGHPRLVCTTAQKTKDEREVFLWDPATRWTATLAGFKPEWLHRSGASGAQGLTADPAYGLHHVAALEPGALHVWPLDGQAPPRTIGLGDRQLLWIGFRGEDDELVAIGAEANQGAPSGMAVMRWGDAGARELPHVRIGESVGASLGKEYHGVTSDWLEEVLAPQDASPDGAFRLEPGSLPAVVRQRDGARLLLWAFPRGTPNASNWESAAIAETGEFVSTEGALPLLRFRLGSSMVDGRLVTGSDVAPTHFSPTLARDFLAGARLPVRAAPQ